MERDILENGCYVLILTYIATFGSTVLGIATVFASLMITGMRGFDAITDPIIGELMDKILPFHGCRLHHHGGGDLLALPGPSTNSTPIQI